jgi:hypothetical protein
MPTPAEDRIRELEGALRPFANLASDDELNHLDECHWGSAEYLIDTEQIRRAKKALL